MMMNEKPLNEFQVAELCGLKVTALRSRRNQGKPPVFYKVGRAVRYYGSDVRAWLEAGRVEPSAE